MQIRRWAKQLSLIVQAHWIYNTKQKSAEEKNEGENQLTSEVMV